MRTQLTGIQRGRLADPLEWVYRID
jgi:branched-chain amino acid aminotransferase